ncbi:hypothetical protein PG988_012305 [Apiospora saccharicola]
MLKTPSGAGEGQQTTGNRFGTEQTIFEHDCWNKAGAGKSAEYSSFKFLPKSRTLVETHSRSKLSTRTCALVTSLAFVGSRSERVSRARPTKVMPLENCPIDAEQRYRYRHLNLAMNKDVDEVLCTRAKISSPRPSVGRLEAPIALSPVITEEDSGTVANHVLMFIILFTCRKKQHYLQDNDVDAVNDTDDPLVYPLTGFFIEERSALTEDQEEEDREDKKSDTNNPKATI